MKKRVIAVFICFCLFFAILSPLKRKAYADPFTASQIASASYAFMAGAGITFNSGSATASGMNDFMTKQIESYVNQSGGSLADVFVGQMAVDVAGKLAMSYDMYNSMKDFVGWLRDKYTLSAEDFSLTDGEYNGLFLPAEAETVTEYVGGYQAVFTNYIGNARYPGYRNVNLKSDGYSMASWTSGTSVLYIGPVTLRYDNNIVVADCVTRDSNNGAISAKSKNVATSVSLNNSLSWNGSEYIQPTVLNPDKEWTGTVGGYSVPDTNLDQLLGNIDRAVADNNLVVDGEVIDIPIPPPTPGPIDPSTPLNEVPWEGLDTNLQNLYNQGLEEIGKIGEAQDAITDAVADQTGALEDAIADNAGTVSGAIEQAVSDVQDAISEQTQTLSESASATAEATETIAEALEDEAINWQKFDLRGLFPFCIPFDIYNMLDALDASPTAPHVQLPFVIESIGLNYIIDLDFSAFDQVAAVMRQMELIVYGIALAWATSKVIKW